MAHACPSQRRIIVPQPLIQPVDLRSLFTPVSHPLPLPLPPPPPRPVSYLAGPFNPTVSDRNRVIVSGYPTVLVVPPAGLRLDHGLLQRMDEIRSQSLIQFMANEGLVPSPEEELKRKDVILQLKKIVLAWIKKVAWQRRLSKEMIACASATALTYGSYGLGVHGTESDIDALCLGPYYATMEEDFFIVLRNMLQSRPEVSDIHCVKSAKVPLMRFKFNGISIDFPYAQLKVFYVPDNVNILEVPLHDIDETSLRSLSGVRANTSILQLVPDVKNFQSMLRCIKLWAKRRGLYSHLLGYLGGIHWAILAAYVCQRYPSASINTLISIFFETFLHWPWPEPVLLGDGLLHTRRPDGRSLMPIMMPCSPFEWCNSNITGSTFTKIKSEFQRGYLMTKDLIMDVEWRVLFESFPYAKRFTHFVRILLAARDADELQDWLGWVKSRFRSLLLKLEEVQGYCDPNPTEYVDHDAPEPNTVFYWGLSPMGSNFTDINYVREEFMKSVESSGYEGRRCKLELSVVDSSHLPETAELESGVGKGSKACWRMLNYNQQRKPVYSQHVPYYFVGYVAAEHPSAVG